MNLKLSKETRKRAVRTYMWPTLMHAAESWTMPKFMQKRQEAMELWLWQRILKILSMRTTNDVLNIIGEKRILIKTLRQCMFFWGACNEKEWLVT